MGREPSSQYQIIQIYQVLRTIISLLKMLPAIDKIYFLNALGSIENTTMGLIYHLKPNKGWISKVAASCSPKLVCERASRFFSNNQAFKMRQIFVVYNILWCAKIRRRAFENKGSHRFVPSVYVLLYCLNSVGMKFARSKNYAQRAQQPTQK